MPKKSYQDFESDLEKLYDLKGLEREEWEINVGFTKGFLTATRGAVVEVISKKHNVKLSKSYPAKSKSEVRKKAVAGAKELIDSILKQRN